jgi:hypothetical protein
MSGIPIPIIRMLPFLALALHAGAAAAPNCGLATPPPGAGIDRQMGVLLKVYPRTPDIGPDYAGCQTLWAQAGDGWETLTIVHYAAGHVVRVENPAVPHDPVEQCLVERGAVVRGDPGLCAQLDDMRFESLPPECAGEAGAAAQAAGACVRA